MTRIYVLLLTLLSIPAMLAQDDFQRLFHDSPRPSREDLRIDLRDEAGNATQLPISILKGSQDGPVFTLVAGVHGFEYPPIIATQQLLNEIDLEELKGTLIVLPIANTASFFTRTLFFNPQDQKNLNRIFPGEAEVTVTQQIAHYITEQVIPVSEVFLDIHGGDACEDLMPFVCYYRHEKRPKQTALAKRLAETSGFECVVSYAYTLADDEPAKYAFKQAVQDGKTGLSIECGKLGNVQAEAVNLIKEGVYNMLTELKMYPGERSPARELMQINQQAYLAAREKGIFYSSYQAGDSVELGEVIGHITDEFGQLLREYQAPQSGIILYKVGTPPVNVDDTLMCIGWDSDEE
ncbi:MAG: succinylglutamate desuccinylase/aspartoacylase family protein [Bacteroidota bacterium]